MSVLGIMSSSLMNLGIQSMQSRMQTARKEFSQLGQDLQSGNLSAAQSDFATLQQMQPQSSASSSTQSTSPITQDFNQLATDLKAGNTTAAQQDYTQLQKDLQTQPPTTQHHHHHHGGGSGSSSNSEIGQLFSQLGSALQSGNLSTAQQAYASLQQDIQQYAQTSASTVSLSA
jgi:outer membrane protein assembly factor BamD (BamD/ComL family)